jgi:hypothetical protein
MPSWGRWLEADVVLVRRDILRGRLVALHHLKGRLDREELHSLSMILCGPLCCA